MYVRTKTMVFNIQHSDRAETVGAEKHSSRGEKAEAAAGASSAAGTWACQQGNDKHGTEDLQRQKYNQCLR